MDEQNEATIICPHCGGAGQNRGIACGPTGGRIGFFKCSDCKGEGRITQEHAERIKVGERLRRDRVDRNVSQREEAKRLGVDVPEWSRIEQGREPETEESRQALARRLAEIAAS